MTVVEQIPTECGFEIVYAGDVDVTIAETPGQIAEVSGHAACFSATHAGGHRLDLLKVQSANGECWVEARRIESSSPWLRNLDGRLRLTIASTSQVQWTELRHARAKSAGWSNLFGATLSELDSGARVSVAQELRAVGALDLGSRRVVLGDEGRRRGALCASFENGNDAVPVLAFLLTRVMPLAHQETST